MFQPMAMQQELGDQEIQTICLKGILAGEILENVLLTKLGSVYSKLKALN